MSKNAGLIAAQAEHQEYLARMAAQADSMANATSGAVTDLLSKFSVDVLKTFMNTHYAERGYTFKVKANGVVVSEEARATLSKVPIGVIQIAIVQNTTKTVKPIVSPYNVLSVCQSNEIDVCVTNGKGCTNLDTEVDDEKMDIEGTLLKFSRGETIVAAPVVEGLIQTDFLAAHFPEFVWLPFDLQQARVATLFGFTCGIKNGKIETYQSFDAMRTAVGLSGRFVGPRAAESISMAAAAAVTLIFSEVSPNGTWYNSNMAGSELAHHLYKALLMGDPSISSRFLLAFASIAGGISTTVVDELQTAWFVYDNDVLTITPPRNFELPKNVCEESCNLQPTNPECSMKQAKVILNAVRSFAGCNEDASSGMIRGQLVGMYLDPMLADVTLARQEIEPYKNYGNIMILSDTKKFPLVEMQALLCMQYDGTVWLTPGSTAGVRLTEDKSEDKVFRFGASKYKIRTPNHVVKLQEHGLTDMLVIDNRYAQVPYTRDTRMYVSEVKKQLSDKIVEYKLSAGVTFLTRTDVVDGVHKILAGEESSKDVAPRMMVYSSVRPHNLVAWVLYNPKVKVAPASRIVFQTDEDYTRYYAFASMCNITRAHAPIYCMTSVDLLAGFGYDELLPQIDVQGLKFINKKALLFDQVQVDSKSASEGRKSLGSTMDAHIHESDFVGAGSGVQSPVNEPADVPAESSSAAPAVVVAPKKRRTMKAEDGDK